MLLYKIKKCGEYDVIRHNMIGEKGEYDMIRHNMIGWKGEYDNLGTLVFNFTIAFVLYINVRLFKDFGWCSFIE